MHRRHYVRSKFRLYQLPPLTHHAEVPAQQRLRRGRSQADDDLGFHCVQFGIQPGTTSVYLRIPRLLVDAPLTTLGRRPLEMFYNIRDVDFIPVDAGFNERLIQQLSRRAHERAAGEVFLISGLFAYEHDRSLRRSLAENRLSCMLPKITGTAISRSAPQSAERMGPHSRLRKLNF